MLPNYYYLIIISWAAFLIIWMIGALTMKRDVRNAANTRYWSWRIASLVIIIAIVLTSSKGRTHRVLSNIIFTPSQTLGWVAAIIVAIGIAIAIWARLYLGRNWSSHPTMKENHELVTSGPYKYVRHPIYTGVILAAFGSLLTGTWFGIIVFIFATITFLLRIRKEEKIMLNLFPNDYPAYQSHTKHLIPFIW